MKTIIILAGLLIAAGIGITTLLPTYEPSDGLHATKTYYQVNQESLKKPLSMTDTLLQALDPPATEYGLRVGLFSQLQQAIDQANKMALSDTPVQIIKATDQQRAWHLLILGPYENKALANSYGLTLLEQHNITSTLIRWPLEVVPAKS